MVLPWFSLCANSFAELAIVAVAELLTSATAWENMKSTKPMIGTIKFIDGSLISTKIEADISFEKNINIYYQFLVPIFVSYL